MRAVEITAADPWDRICVARVFGPNLDRALEGSLAGLVGVRSRRALVGSERVAIAACTIAVRSSASGQARSVPLRHFQRAGTQSIHGPTSRCFAVGAHPLRCPTARAGVTTRQARALALRPAARAGALTVRARAVRRARAVAVRARVRGQARAVAVRARAPRPGALDSGRDHPSQRQRRPGSSRSISAPDSPGGRRVRSAAIPPHDPLPSARTPAMVPTPSGA